MTKHVLRIPALGQFTHTHTQMSYSTYTYNHAHSNLLFNVIGHVLHHFYALVYLSREMTIIIMIIICFTESAPRHRLIFRFFSFFSLFLHSFAHSRAFLSFLFSFSLNYSQNFSATFDISRKPITCGVL